VLSRALRASLPQSIRYRSSRSALIAMSKPNPPGAPLPPGFGRSVLLGTGGGGGKKPPGGKLHGFVGHNEDVCPAFSTRDAFAVLTLAQAEIPSDKAARGPGKRTPKAKRSGRFQKEGDSDSDDLMADDDPDCWCTKCINRLARKGVAE